MSFSKKIKKLLYKTDFFHTVQLLRYKQQPEYRTVCGGLLSVIILCMLIVTFYNKLIDTINKTNVISKSQNSNAADPTSFNISTYPQAHFMFGVQIWHHNLNNDTRKFDIVLKNLQYDTGQEREDSPVYPLQPCTLDHWTGFPDIQANFTRLSMQTWLCLPRNMKYNIQGKYASVYSQTLRVSVQKCTNKSSESRKCASPEEIDDFFQKEGPFFFTIYFINPLINPGSHEYIKYYLEDNNYIIFTKRFGSEGILFMEQYKITTDQSIIPITQIHQVSGGVVSQFALKNPYQITEDQDIYCSFAFFKSGTAWTHQRSYEKIDNLFAYIGGLFGIIAISLFIVNVYNAHSFELNLAAYLFHKKDIDQKNRSRRYNFISFIVHKTCDILTKLGFNPNWEKTKYFQQCRQQMLKQLDIMYLIQRVSFLEKVFDNFIEPHQLRGLHLLQKPTLKQAKQKRKNFRLKQKLFKLLHQQQMNNVDGSSQKFSQNLKVQYNQPQLFQTFSAEGLNKSNNPALLKIKRNQITQQNNEKQRQLTNQELQQKIYDELINDEQDEDECNSEQEDQTDHQSTQRLIQDITQLQLQAQFDQNQMSKKIWNKIKLPLQKKISKLIRPQNYKSKRYIGNQVNDNTEMIINYMIKSKPQQTQQYSQALNQMNQPIFKKNVSIMEYDLDNPLYLNRRNSLASFRMQNPLYRNQSIRQGKRISGLQKISEYNE